VQLLGLTRRESLQATPGKLVFPLHPPVPALKPLEPLPETRIEPFRPLMF
jgi:hypothetical protein